MRKAPDRLRDLGWKLAAVVLAYAFWLAAVDEPLALRDLEVPVNFENLAADLALLRDRPSSIIVRVQAPEPRAKDLQSTDVQARIDLGGLREGRHRVRLGPGGPAIAPRRIGIKVIEVFPPSLEVTLEPKLATDVPVHALLSGSPPEGYEVGSVKIAPPHIRISGPASAVRQTVEARTSEISLAGRTESFEETAFIDVASPDVLIHGEPRVRVTVPVTERSGEKVFSDLAVVFVNSPDEARATPRAVRAKVRGPVRVLAQLTREDVLALADLKGLAPRPASYHPAVRIDFTRDLFRDKLQVVGSEPAAVEVRIAPRRPPAPRRESQRGG